MAILRGLPPSNTISTGGHYYRPKPFVEGGCSSKGVSPPWEEPGLSVAEKAIRKLEFERQWKDKG